jgi:hypothetical protein
MNAFKIKYFNASVKIENLTFILISVTYLVYLYICYGTDPSPVFLNVDQAYFKSILHALEKSWSLFPTSLENVANQPRPYHHLDSQIKWLFTLIFPTNISIIITRILFYLILVYSLMVTGITQKRMVLILLFTFYLLKVPSPGELTEMVFLPFDFNIRSDIFQNCNTLLAFACLAFIFKLSFTKRLIIHFLSFYIKSPATPAFLIVEIYLLFFHPNSRSISFVKNMGRLLMAGTVLTISFFVFFYSPANNVSHFMTNSALIEFHIKTDINWFSNGLLLYDALVLLILLGSRRRLNPWFLYIYVSTVLFLLIYDSIGMIRINIKEFVQVELFLRFALIMTLFHETKHLHQGHYFKKGISFITTLVMLFSCYTLSHFSVSLLTSRLHRFSEYLDNRPLIEITRPILSSEDIVAYNTLNSNIRKNKQLQLCGIVRNPIWVSNLKYVSSLEHPKVKQDWIILENALEGKEEFPVAITWLIIKKDQKKYNINIIERQFDLVKATETHLLFKRNGPAPAEPPKSQVYNH